MAGEGGKRKWWPTHMGVNISNGNLHLELGSGSCVTCGGSDSGGAYPNPQNTKLNGPILIYNTLGTPDTDLGPKWMLPYDASVDWIQGTSLTLIDCDGTGGPDKLILSVPRTQRMIVPFCPG